MVETKRISIDQTLINENKAIFLDRDGTLNNDEGHYYIYKIEDLNFNSGVVAGLKRLYDAGYKLIVISNQGGIAKSEYSKVNTDKFHSEINRILLENGCFIEEFYYCPHHNNISACLCRKPFPLMIEKACARFGINKDISFMIGDSNRDVDAAKAIGVKSYLIPKNSDFSVVVNQILGK